MARWDQGIWTTLNKDHIEECHGLADIRQGNADRLELCGHNGAPATGPEAWAIHYHGVRCEMAFKLVFRPRYWDRIGTVGKPDFDGWIDIKGRSKGWHDMPVQKKGNPSWGYVLVTSDQHPHYRIVGWAKGWAVKVEDKWGDPSGKNRPAYWMKQRDLWPLSELRELMDFWESLRERDEV